MFGLFLCFVLPGIVAGILLSQGSRAVKSHTTRRQVQRGRDARASAGQARRSQNAHTRPDKSRLYIYDLRQDQTMGRAVASATEHTVDDVA